MPIRKALRKYSPIKDRTFANGLTFASPLSLSSTALSYIQFAVVCVFMCVRVCLCCYGIRWWCIHELVLTMPCLYIQIRDMYTCMCICMHCAHLNRIWVCSHKYTHIYLYTWLGKVYDFDSSVNILDFIVSSFALFFVSLCTAKFMSAKNATLLGAFKLNFAKKKKQPTTYPMETNILCGMKSVWKRYRGPNCNV